MNRWIKYISEAVDAYSSNPSISKTNTPRTQRRLQQTKSEANETLPSDMPPMSSLENESQPSDLGSLSIESDSISAPDHDE